MQSPRLKPMMRNNIQVTQWMANLRQPASALRKVYFVSQNTIFKHLHQTEYYKMHLNFFCICVQL